MSTRSPNLVLRLGVAGAVIVAALAASVDRATQAAPTMQNVVDVMMVDHAFQPARLTVEVGTTIRWTNNGESPHTATSDDGRWDSGPLQPGETFSYTFDTPGTHRYHCMFHGAMGMRGEIVVAHSTVPTATAAATAPPGGGSSGNLARGRPAYASSSQAGHPPALGTDGNTGSYWASQPGGGANSQWYYVDLGAQRSIDELRVLWTASGRPQRYGVYVYGSWCGGWCQLGWVTSSDGDDRLRLTGNVSTRYVLLLMQYPLSSFGAYALRELEVFGASSPPPGGGGDNVALGRPAHASSALFGYGPERATDGRTLTSWRSAGLPAWLYVDFGQTVAVDRAVLRWGSGGYHASQFALYAWSGAGWYAVHSDTFNANTTNDVRFQPTTTRYLLVYALSSPVGRVDLRELEVYRYGSAAFEAQPEGDAWTTVPDAPVPDVAPEGALPLAPDDATGLGTWADPLQDRKAGPEGAPLGDVPEGLPDLGDGVR